MANGYASAGDASAFGATSVDAFLESVLYPWSMLSPGDIVSPDGPPGGTGSSSDAAGGCSSASDAAGGGTGSSSDASSGGSSASDA